MIEAKVIQEGTDYLRSLFPPQTSEIFGRTCYRDSFILSAIENKEGLEIIVTGEKLTKSQVEQLKKVMGAQKVTLA